MKLSDSVKSISYLKANAAALVEDIYKNGKTFVITQNGEAKVVVQDIKVYEQMQDTLAMLKLLSMSSNGQSGAKEMTEVFDELYKELDELE
ncbi:MAG: type II toxin-antitoxin system Phd/YefM family antitoxin [Bacteroidetes bacterium]|nr:type II toxin-antitoxin system Phd/YefM family antitoxin [Bacteroidota bacterium]